MDLDVAVRDLAPRLLGYCFLRTGDRTLAEDAAQEALTALVRRWRRHGPPESPPAFAFAIARRRAARALLRRRLWLPLEIVAGRAAVWGDPESGLLVRTERERVVAGLSALPRRDREVLLMVTVGGLTLSEAASALSLSVSAVKMRALRARRRLGQILEKADGSN